MANRERVLAAGIVLLGLLHALIYAASMPPWGLLDEPQHFHYVEFIAENGALPVMWRDRLSPEVMDSMFAAKRYVTLGDDRMPDRADLARPGQPDDQSYEAYHPPFYYAALSLLYPFGPADVLGKLYMLRAAGAILSCLTLIVVWKSTRLLWPGQPWIAAAATLALALNPERAASAGRVSNDVMLEVISAVAFGLLARALAPSPSGGLARGPTWRLALGTSITLGLLALTKTSGLMILPAVVLGWVLAAFLRGQPWRPAAGQILAILGGTAGCLLPLTARNLILYQDPTGLGAFIARIGPLTSGPLLQLVGHGIVDLFRNSWVVLWDGARVVGKPSATLMLIALAAETCLLAALVARAWLGRGRQLTPPVRSALAVSVLAIALVSLSTLVGTVQGLVPGVQGRFLLAAALPAAWLLGFGLWLMGEEWRGLGAAVLFTLEAALSLSVLFFHALPNFYAPRAAGFLGYWRQTAYLLFDPSGMFWDKPAFVNIWTFGVVVAAFAACGSLVAALAIARYGWPVGRSQFRAVSAFLKAHPLAPPIPKAGNQSSSSLEPPSANGFRDRQAASPITPDPSPRGRGESTQVDFRRRSRRKSTEQDLLPLPPLGEGGRGDEGRSGRLLRLASDPLLWVGLALLAVYLGWVSRYPPGIFWSLDEGGKYIHLQSIVASGDAAAPLLYPGRYLDQNLNFVPLYYWSLWKDQVYSWWPVSFPLITYPFYRWLGWMGLYALPALAGAGCAVLAGLLVRTVYPERRWPPGVRGGWLAAGAALVTGLATPVAFYSTVFWEHTLSAACVSAAVLCLLHAWRTGRARWLVGAAILFSWVTYLRSDSAAMAAGIGLALLAVRWRWALLWGAGYAAACLPWLASNTLLMGAVLGREWTAVNGLTVPLGEGLRQAGIWFVPYALFNAPFVGAFPVEPAVLLLATALVGLALAAPFVRRPAWSALPVYAGLLVICGLVLAQPQGYRSVHGFVLIAPHVVLAAWLFASRETRRTSPLALVLAGAVGLYGVAYLARSWVAAGGLQWGPRYLLPFYPLLVAASVVGLAAAWARPDASRTVKYGLLVLYLLGVLIGVGYQLRGAEGALETRNYYRDSEQAIRDLQAPLVVSDCPWLAMVMPDLYWSGSVFTVEGDQAFGAWVGAARRVGARSVCRVTMDLCQLTPLDQIARQRAANPGGIEAVCYGE